MRRSRSSSCRWHRRQGSAQGWLGGARRGPSGAAAAEKTSGAGRRGRPRCCDGPAAAAGHGCAFSLHAGADVGSTTSPAARLLRSPLRRAMPLPAAAAACARQHMCSLHCCHSGFLPLQLAATAHAAASSARLPCCMHPSRQTAAPAPPHAAPARRAALHTPLQPPSPAPPRCRRRQQRRSSSGPRHACRRGGSGGRQMMEFGCQLSAPAASGRCRARGRAGCASSGAAAGAGQGVTTGVRAESGRPHAAAPRRMCAAGAAPRAAS